MRYQETIRTLVEAYPGLTPELKKAAHFIVENPGEIGLNSMRGVARDAGVKPATITRLSKTLGFDTYDALREPFRERLRKRSPDYATRLKDIRQRGELSDASLLQDFRAQEVANIEGSLSDENIKLIVSAAETISSSRRIYVLGLRGAHAPAFLFHYSHQLFQENSRFLDTGAGTFADQLRGISEDDALLVISFPPYTQLTIDAVDYAAESGARVIAITDSVISPVANAAQQTIVTKYHSPSFYHSLVGALAVVQALVTILVTKAGGDAVQIIQETEKQLSRISAYW